LTLNNISLRYRGPPRRGYPGASTFLNPTLMLILLNMLFWALSFLRVIVKKARVLRILCALFSCGDHLLILSGSFTAPWTSDQSIAVHETVFFGFFSNYVISVRNWRNGLQAISKFWPKLDVSLWFWCSNDKTIKL